jgi:hypothetical protein
MTADSVDDAWMETCLITISLEGAGVDMGFAGLTETVDFDIGDKDIEGVAILNGGRVTKFSPESDTTLTFEAYPVEAGTKSGTTGTGFFDMMHTVDASQPLRIVNDHTRSKYRIAVLWTNDGAATTAVQTTAANKSGLRIAIAEARITSVKPSFTDGILKFTVIAKCAAYDKAADSNVMMESTDGTAQLPAIAAYTTGNKFA